VRRADRGGLEEKCGRSEELLKAFYTMFVATRARHFLPPIPYIWFRNLAQCLGDKLEVRMAHRGAIPLAAILMLRFKDTVYYKYSGSDVAFNKFGATPWLLWKAIVAAKSNNAIKLDMGRTEENNVTLSVFKNHWVSEPKLLTYWRFPERTLIGSLEGWKFNTARRVFSYMPNALLRITGRLIYRHIG
jgi:predicted N-acyltransferase